MNTEKPVFVHIVTYNSAEWIVACLESVLRNADLVNTIRVTDNASADNTVELIKEKFANKIELHCNQHNLGFSGAHNQGAAAFLASGAGFLMVLNPDVVLDAEFLAVLLPNITRSHTIGALCGKLLRFDSRIDSAGMIFNRALRHVDRGSEEIDSGQYDVTGYVAGATGACVVFSKEFVRDVSFRAARDQDAAKVYPQLSEGMDKRVQLFDEAFFAYREDAELAWRSAQLGWQCLYNPRALAHHARRVTPERRQELPKQINLWSVRNRFLMQVNCFRFAIDMQGIFQGLILRNLMVIFAVLFKEQSSLEAFNQFFLLLPRAYERRRALKARAKDRRQYPIFLKS
jgi:GT2 family glycosyltransferase